MTNKKIRWDFWTIVTVVIIALFALFLLYPLISLFLSGFKDTETGVWTIDNYAKFFILQSPTQSRRTSIMAASSFRTLMKLPRTRISTGSPSGAMRTTSNAVPGVAPSISKRRRYSGALLS